STANRTAAGRGWSRHEAVKARIREPTNIQRYSRSPNITFLSQSHDYRSDRRVRVSDRPEFAKGSFVFKSGRPIHEDRDRRNARLVGDSLQLWKGKLVETATAVE